MDINADLERARKIWVLKLVAECESLSKAAVRANVSKSAVSQTLSSLEKQARTRLIARQGNVTKLSEAGLSLVRSAEGLFTELSKMKEREATTGPAMSYLDFGTYESLAIRIVPALLARLRRQQPKLRLKIEIGRSQQIASKLRKGELCMAVLTEGDYLNRLNTIPLAQDRLGLYVGKGVQGKLSSLIRDLGLGVLQSGPSGYPLYYSRFSRALGTLYKPTLFSESYEALRMVAAKGVAVCLLPNGVAESRPGELRELTPKDLNEREQGLHQIFLVTPPNCDREEADFLAAELKSIMGSESVGAQL